MLFVKNLLFLAAAAPAVMATPVDEGAVTSLVPTPEDGRAGVWAQFCNDNACSQGCGQSVDLSNPGCLNQSGRKSIRFHGSGGGDHSLVVSPGSDCPCQSTCATVPSGSECWDISDYSDALSFRFIGGGCDPNNC